MLRFNIMAQCVHACGHISTGGSHYKMWAGLNRFDPPNYFALGGAEIGMGCTNVVTVISRYTSGRGSTQRECVCMCVCVCVGGGGTCTMTMVTTAISCLHLFTHIVLHIFRQKVSPFEFLQLTGDFTILYHSLHDKQ